MNETLTKKPLLVYEKIPIFWDEVNQKFYSDELKGKNYSELSTLKRKLLEKGVVTTKLDSPKQCYLINNFGIRRQTVFVHSINSKGVINYSSTITPPIYPNRVSLKHYNVWEKKVLDKNKEVTDSFKTIEILNTELEETRRRIVQETSKLRQLLKGVKQIQVT